MLQCFCSGIITWNVRLDVLWVFRLAQSLQHAHWSSIELQEGLRLTRRHQQESQQTGPRQRARSLGMARLFRAVCAMEQGEAPHSRWSMSPSAC